MMRETKLALAFLIIPWLVLVGSLLGVVIHLIAFNGGWEAEMETLQPATDSLATILWVITFSAFFGVVIGTPGGILMLIKGAKEKKRALLRKNQPHSKRTVEIGDEI